MVGYFHQLSRNSPNPSQLGRALIEPAEPAGNDGHDNVNGDLIFHENEQCQDGLGHIYQIIQRLGCGNFGQVYEVILMNPEFGDPRAYAMKVSKSTPLALNQFHYEEQVLTYLKSQFPQESLDHACLLESSFRFRNHEIIILPKFGPSLLDSLEFNGYHGLELKLVQKVLIDILGPLDTLSRLHLIHCDVKPENILLDSHDSQNLRLIDFGSCCVQGDPNFRYVQSRYYRAPEVALELSFDSKADVWSLGCVAAELLLGLPLFPSSSTAHHLYLIDQMLGPFPGHIINQSPRSSEYFSHETAPGTPRRIKSEEEFQQIGISFGDFQPYFYQTRLPDIILSYEIEAEDQDAVNLELRHRNVFIDLLNHMLALDPEERYSAEEALHHPFFSLKL